MTTTIDYLAPDCELAAVLESALVCASHSSYHSYFSDSRSGSRDGDESSWLEDFNPTRNYYGRHGEFDRNDENRKECEDIREFHTNYPDVELTDHYDWNDVLEAETDGYLDD